LIFDFDPAPELRFVEVIDAARTVRKMLDRIELKSFVKTTGGKGLHVVVPLKRKQDWDGVKNFALAMATALAQAMPSRFTANLKKEARHGKIFVDYLRNGRGSTAVAAYSLRARPGAPVSTPVEWDELTKNFRADRFTLKTVPHRLERLRRDPWRDINSIEQTISADLIAAAAR
jgi:bifunctional non-homologous end joining protein LigD